MYMYSVVHMCYSACVCACARWDGKACALTALCYMYTYNIDTYILYI